MRCPIRTTALLFFPLLVAAAAHAAPLVTVNDTAPGPVERLATLDFIATEVAVTLGVEPVAVASPEAYADWVGVSSEALADARDVGLRQEPDLEALAAASPDLIVGADFRHRPLVPALRRIAPVVLYDWVPAASEGDQLARIRGLVTDLGRRLGRPARASEALRGMDARLDRQTRRLREAGLEGAPVVIAQHAPGTDRFHLYVDHSLGVRIAERLGLDNRWRGEAGIFGFQTVSLEALARIEQAHILLAATPGDSAFEQLRTSPLWTALPAVSAGRVHRLPPHTWYFGGPVTVGELAREFADALIAGNTRPQTH